MCGPFLGGGSGGSEGSGVLLIERLLCPGELNLPAPETIFAIFGYPFFTAHWSSAQ